MLPYTNQEFLPKAPLLGNRASLPPLSGFQGNHANISTQGHVCGKGKEVPRTFAHRSFVGRDPGEKTGKLWGAGHAGDQGQPGCDSTVGLSWLQGGTWEAGPLGGDGGGWDSGGWASSPW